FRNERQNFRRIFDPDSASRPQVEFGACFLPPCLCRLAAARKPCLQRLTFRSQLFAEPACLIEEIGAKFAAGTVSTGFCKHILSTREEVLQCRLHSASHCRKKFTSLGTELSFEFGLALHKVSPFRLKLGEVSFEFRLP